MHDTIFFSACDLINLYKSKKLSPVENLKNTFDVIKKLNPKLNAFISMSEKKAMKQAKFSELRYLNRFLVFQLFFFSNNFFTSSFYGYDFMQLF